MAEANDPSRVHCYTNPSFCRQSEFIADESGADLPPPIQFQGEDLPLPPPPQQLQYGQSNSAFYPAGEPVVTPCPTPSGRYAYLQEPQGASVPVPIDSHHRRYASLPVEEMQLTYGQGPKYYIHDERQLEEAPLQRHGSSRYAYAPGQQVLRCSPRSTPQVKQDEARVQVRNNAGNAGRYAEIPGDQSFSENKLQYRDRDVGWTDGGRNYSSSPQQVSSSRGDFLFLYNYLVLNFALQGVRRIG